MTPSQQQAYDECLANGCSETLALMLAMRQAPFGMTDSVFLEGHCNGSQFERVPGAGDFYAREARAAGVDVTGKVYMAGLAERPGDPRAWVSGRGDVQRLCEERGWECNGAVKVKAKPARERKKVDVAADLIDDEVTKTLVDHPEPKSVNVQDLREKIHNKRKPRYTR